MKLANLIHDETGVDFDHILLLRHFNSIGRLVELGGTIEEFTALQPTESKWDFWARGKQRIDVVVAVVRDSVYGVYRVQGIKKEGIASALASKAHQEFDRELDRGKMDFPVRLFNLQKLSSAAQDVRVTGWEGKEISALLRSNGSLFWEIEVNLPERPLVIAEAADLTYSQISDALDEDKLRFGDVETSVSEAIVRQRKGQDVLRDRTLKAYGTRCAICEITEPELLRASHIKGWAECEDSRGLLSNVICLCVFHDALFENGFWSLDDQLRIVIRKKINGQTIRAYCLQVVCSGNPRYIVRA